MWGRGQGRLSIAETAQCQVSDFGLDRGERVGVNGPLEKSLNGEGAAGAFVAAEAF